jgi:hypothetical protein
MSEVILDTITGKSTATTITIGSTPVVSSSANSMTIRGEGTAQTSIQQGLAKAWSHLDVGSGTPSIADSFNIASVTDVSTGNTTNTFTNAMNNDNYSVPSSTDAFNFSSIESYATTGYAHRTANNSATQVDRDHTVSATFGDLA